MKKSILFILFSLFLIANIFAIGYSAPYPFLLQGNVGSNTVLSVNLFPEIFPFDLEGESVQYNPNPNQSIIGLRIGQYSLVSNDPAFQITITHDYLTNIDYPESKADYILSVITNYYNQDFEYCGSNDNAISYTTSGEKIVLTQNSFSQNAQGTYNVAGNSIYVNMNESSTFIDSLHNGTFESNIYFFVTIED